MIFQFLFQSVGGIYFLIVLYVIDFLSGVAKAIYKKELVSKKFPRFLFTMLAALMILSILKFAGMYVIVFYPLYSIFYGVFTGQQIISIAENLTELKLLPLSLLNKLKRRFGDRFK
ncbi:phage holin family protein [Echinicola sp. 20G]|uniref:phage holin family protein n=1 Tax=Echinicola sp. 20G TaxID=2781961 RepID=UPI001F2E3EB8|nr:phage holin family protein [Echinicola sp. 20G]